MFSSVMVMTDILMEELKNKCKFNNVFADACESQKQQVLASGGAGRFIVLL